MFDRIERLLKEFNSKRQLTQEGYPAINMKFADRRKYYDCFTSYHQSGCNPEEMVKLISGYVGEALERYINILKKLKLLFHLTYNTSNKE